MYVTCLTSMLLSLKCIAVAAWTTEELFMYDLVEEVGRSFYDFYGIPKDATVSNIKKAYRRLSMEWHPDRNSDENAEDQFRKIAAIYEVLKSHNLREKYDSILENGLPNWKQPVFYYRRARKLSWFEAVIVVVIVCSIGHYFMLWGAYIDKYLTLFSNRNKLRKKEIRQMKKIGSDAETVYEEKMTKMLSDVCPSWRNSLPALMISLLYNVIISLPDFIRNYIDIYQLEAKKSEESKSDDVLRNHYVAIRQPVYEYAVASDVKPVLSCPFTDNSTEKSPSQSNNSVDKSVWTSDELALLVKLSTEKYPAGTPNRWELIAKLLNRPPQNVTLMVGKLKQMKKDEYAKLLRSSQSSIVVQNAAQITSVKQSNQLLDEQKSKWNISKEDRDEGKETVSVIWSDNEQRLFEAALQEFPKGTAGRWEKIANCVSSKTKQQCVERFKYLTELVRQKKVQHKNKK
uniref:DnaJ homolog subfamily C member 1 n=1 Tax=Setaria digitata TaxID=48799 RepID=A0A915PYU5_9BILA